MPDRSNDKGRDERAAETTIDELADVVRDGFKNVLGEVKSVRGELVGVQAQMKSLDVRLHVVEMHVWGSPSRRPPPPPPASPQAPQPGAAAASGATKRASMTEEVKDAHEQLAEFQGRLLAVEGKVETGLAINKQQSRAMGLAKPDSSIRERAARLFLSREGIKLLVGAVITILSALGYVSANRAADRAAPHAIEQAR